MDVFDQATELERIERESALRQVAAGTFQEGPEGSIFLQQSLLVK